MVPDDTAEDPESRLCRACGICCKGALFSWGSLTEEEAPRLRNRLPIIPSPDGDGEAFDIPCPLHAAEGCTIYTERPKTCVGYACLQLSRLRNGKTTFEEALRTVTEVAELIASLEARLPPGRSLWARAATLRAAGEPEAVAERRRHAVTLLDLRVLERRLVRDLDERVARCPS